MRRRILMAVLAVGTVAGFASGFASMHRCNAHGRGAWERHVAKVCVEAARGEKAAAEAPPDDE